MSVSSSSLYSSLTPSSPYTWKTHAHTSVTKTMKAFVFHSLYASPAPSPNWEWLQVPGPLYFETVENLRVWLGAFLKELEGKTQGIYGTEFEDYIEK